MNVNSNVNLVAEFDRQVGNLLEKEYPRAAGLSEEEFLALVLPLKPLVQSLDGVPIDYGSGRLPFVLVVSRRLVPIDFSMSQVSLNGRTGIIKLFPLGPTDFQTISNVAVPENHVYILVDIDRGMDTRNLPPSEAFTLIESRYRSPLIIEEGIAIVTHFPDFLMKNNCFSLLASRTGKDQRVPAIWINGQKEPNLGWCWNGNPHTWLGSASCARRVGA